MGLVDKLIKAGEMVVDHAAEKVSEAVVEAAKIAEEVAKTAEEYGDKIGDVAIEVAQMVTGKPAEVEPSEQKPDPDDQPPST
jgi:polyhydroxyalkanoate synthesis regulator phasin